MIEEPSTAEIVAREVRVACARYGVRHRALAEVLGLSTAAISRRFAGDVEFTVSELRIIAQLMGVPLTSLLPTEEPAVAVRSAS